MENEFYDRCYEAWYRGENPDLVSEEKWDFYRSEGFEPNEISLKMIYPKKLKTSGRVDGGMANKMNRRNW